MPTNPEQANSAATHLAPKRVFPKRLLVRKAKLKGIPRTYQAREAIVACAAIGLCGVVLIGLVFTLPDASSKTNWKLALAISGAIVCGVSGRNRALFPALTQYR